MKGVLKQVIEVINSKYLAYLQRFAPYLITLLLCLLSNFIYYQYLLESQNKKDVSLLNKYINDIGTSIVSNFKTSTQNNNNNLSFFTYFDIAPNVDNDMGSKYESTYITTSSRVLVLNKPALKQFVDNFLPPYINYQILSNNTLVARNQISQKNINTQAKYKINNDNSLIIKLGINKQHSDYQKAIYEI